MSDGHTELVREPHVIYLEQERRKAADMIDPKALRWTKKESTP